MPPKNRKPNDREKIQNAISNLQNNQVTRVEIVGDDAVRLVLVSNDGTIEIDNSNQSVFTWQKSKGLLEALISNDSISVFVFDSMTQSEQQLFSNFFQNKIIKKLELQGFAVSTPFMKQICDRLRASKEQLKSITIDKADIEIESLCQLLKLTEFSAIQELNVSFAGAKRWEIYKTLIKALPNCPQIKRLNLWAHDEVEKMTKGGEEIMTKMAESMSQTLHLVEYQDDFFSENFPVLKQYIDKKFAEKQHAEKQLKKELDILHNRATKEPAEPKPKVVDKPYTTMVFGEKNALTKFNLAETLKKLSASDGFVMLAFDNLSNLMLTDEANFEDVFSNKKISSVKIEENDLGGVEEKNISRFVVKPILNNPSVQILSLARFEGKYLNQQFVNHAEIYLLDLTLEDCGLDNIQALQILKNCFYLRRLNLTDNNLNGKQKNFSEAASAIVKNPIVELVLDGNEGLGAKGLTVLLAQLDEDNLTLNELSLNNCGMDNGAFNSLITALVTAKSLMLKKIRFAEADSPFNRLTIQQGLKKLENLAKNRPVPDILFDETDIEMSEDSESEGGYSEEIAELIKKFGSFSKKATNKKQHKAFFVELLAKRIEKIEFVDTQYLTYLLQNVFNDAIEHAGDSSVDDAIIKEVFKAYQTLGLNVKDYEEKLLKYLGHSYKLAEAKVALDDAETIELEGWHTDKFLDTLIMSLFYTLTLLFLKKVHLPQRSMVEAIKQQLLNELAFACNTRMLSKFADEIHENCAPADQKISFNKLADSLLAKLNTMSENASVCIATGYEEHAIYVHLIKTAGDMITIRVDNCGDFSEAHPKKSGKILPLILGEFELTVPQHSSIVKKYIVHLFECQFLTREEFKKQRAIYGFPNLSKLLHNDSLPSRPAQTTGNCVFESYDIGTEIRIHQPEIYSWLKNQMIITLHELKFLVDQNNPSDHNDLLQDKKSPIAKNTRS